MANANSRTGAVKIDGALPRGWSQTGSPENNHRVTLTGPAGASGATAQIEIEVVTGTGGIEDATERVIDELRSLPVERLVASCDIWPHRQWGTGRQVQSAFVTHDTTMAHDVYVFVDGDHELRVTLLCPLADLLRLEEDCASIVAAVSVSFSRAVSCPETTVHRPSSRVHLRRHMRAVRAVCGAGSGAGAI